MAQETFEYAGFEYTLGENTHGEPVMIPVPGQHPAASKDKHCRAALEEYQADQRAKR